MDEQFQGEDPVDEEGLNATQRRAEEEGTIWRDTGPAEVVTGPQEEEEEEEEGPTAA